ncbi:MAG: hypothetical protein BWY85_00290 [Firmicutes bacterium ADurb.Bin506]|nr:MAG: hypothetical protein BWY85_00290 [Firmicutes bacterium ADurb.Bin506]
MRCPECGSDGPHTDAAGWRTCGTCHASWMVDPGRQVVSTTPTVSGMDPEIESRLKRAAVRSNRAREDLEQAIIDAFLAGAGQREIARAVDMSHPAVKYILDRHQNERDDVANEVQRRGTLRKGTTER